VRLGFQQVRLAREPEFQAREQESARLVPGPELLSLLLAQQGLVLAQEREFPVREQEQAWEPDLREPPERG
jgi:hypothetical protein